MGILSSLGFSVPIFFDSDKERTYILTQRSFDLNDRISWQQLRQSKDIGTMFLDVVSLYCLVAFGASSRQV